MGVHIMHHKEMGTSITASTIFNCIRITCKYCAEGDPIFRYDGDDNFYHNVTSPCHAHAIRRHFNITGKVADGPEAIYAEAE